MAVITLRSNVSALRAERSLRTATKEAATPLERLATGLRIQRAADDAAGLSIASVTGADARVRAVGIRNLNDGVDMLAIADAALVALSDIATRLGELAAQASNGALADAQRAHLDDEAAALVSEYNRITRTTSYNGFRLLDGQTNQAALQAGYGLSGAVPITFGQQLGPRAGTGTYSQTDSGATPFDAYYGTVSDLNGDGYDDLIHGRSGGSGFAVLLGNADGTLDAPMTFVGVPAGGSSAVRTADINGDGIPDVIEQGFFAAHVLTYIGQGDGTFSFAHATPTSGIPHLETGDMNGDGKLDIVTQDYLGSDLSVFLGDGTGRFSLSYQRAPFPFAESIIQRLVDFNGDGNLDVLTSHNDPTSALLYYGNGDGTLADPISFTAMGAGGAAVADLNGDGRLDIAVSAHGGPVVTAYLQQADGSFGSGIVSSTNLGTIQSYHGTPAVADLNEDGLPDLVVAAFGANGYSTMLSNGDGTFTSSQIVGNGLSGGAPPLVADADGDGKLDLIDVVSTNPRVYLGDGRGHFSSATPASFGFAPEQRFVGDIDGDEILDLVGIDVGTRSYAVLRGTPDPVRTVTAIAADDYKMNTLLDARRALDKTKTLTRRVAAGRAELGASESRLRTAIGTSAITREEELQAVSRIVDADVTDEAARLRAAQIKQQSSLQVLREANTEPQLALTILRRIA